MPSPSPAPQPYLSDPDFVLYALQEAEAEERFWRENPERRRRTVTDRDQAGGTLGQLSLLAEDTA